MPQSKVGPEIHRRLLDGQPNDTIARAVGRKVRIIQKHAAGECTCPPLDVVEEVADPVAVPPLGRDAMDTVGIIDLAYQNGIALEDIADTLGIGQIDVDAQDFGIGDGAGISPRRVARLHSDAIGMGRLKEHHPARWASSLEARNRDARKLILNGAIPLETVHSLLKDIRRVTSGLLSSDHPNRFTDWPFWDSIVGDFLTIRYPEIGLIEGLSSVYQPIDSVSGEGTIEALEEKIGPVVRLRCADCGGPYRAEDLGILALAG